MSQIDHREIVYRQIFKLDMHGKNYYQDLIHLVGLLLSDDERNELAQKIIDVRHMFDDGIGDELPSFFALENAFYDMTLNKRTFIKMRTKDGFRKIQYHQIAEKFNALKNWLFQKLYEVQKTIRFSNLNTASP